MVEPASWSCAWLPAAPGRCSFSRCSSVAPATGDAPVHSRSSRRSASGSSPRRSPSWSTSATTDGRAAEALLYQSLRSDIPELRTASVTALANLAERHDWAIDGLVEALAEASENPVRVAGELDRLAPRPGPRLPPLLGHPNPVVRSYAARLLSRYPALAEQHVPACTSDPSPNVRGAALETLRAAGSPAALRHALRLLEDPHPQVRAQACRTAAAVSGRASATYLVPLLARHVVVGARGGARGARHGR